MPIQRILQLGDPLLREKCGYVEDPTASEIKELVHDLSDTLAHWRATTGYGRGIAAPPIKRCHIGIRALLEQIEMSHASPPSPPAVFDAGTLSALGSATGEPVTVFQTLGRVFGTRRPAIVKNIGIV